MPPKVAKARSSAHPTVKAKAPPKPKAARAATGVATTTTTTTVTTTTTTTTAAAAPAKPKAKATKTAASPKAKASSKAAVISKAATSKAATPKAATKAGPKATAPKAQAEPKAAPKATTAPKAPSAAKTVHNVLLRWGSKFRPFTPSAQGIAANGGDAGLATALPRGSGLVALSESDVWLTRLTESLMSKLASTDQPAPLHAAEALRTVGALGIAVDQLLGMSSIWTPARKWTPRTWTRVVLDHCPSLGFSATEPDGTKVGFVELAKGDHAALSKAAKGKVQIPVAKAVIPPGHDVKIAMQVFYAMHARKWSIALLIDETSFVVAHKEGMALTLSPPQNLAKPKVLSLLGAMLEIVRLGRNKIPAGDEVKPAATAAPRTKQTARRGGAPASFSSAHMVDQKPQYDSDDYAERFKYESDGDLYYGFDNARSIKEAMFGYDSDGRRYSTNDEANVNSDHSDWGY